MSASMSSRESVTSIKNIEPNIVDRLSGDIPTHEPQRALLELARHANEVVTRVKQLSEGAVTYDGDSDVIPFANRQEAVVAGGAYQHCGYLNGLQVEYSREITKRVGFEVLPDLVETTRIRVGDTVFAFKDGAIEASYSRFGGSVNITTEAQLPTPYDSFTHQVPQAKVISRNGADLSDFWTDAANQIKTFTDFVKGKIEISTDPNLTVQPVLTNLAFRFRQESYIGGLYVDAPGTKSVRINPETVNDGNMSLVPQEILSLFGDDDSDVITVITKPYDAMDGRLEEISIQTSEGDSSGYGYLDGLRITADNNYRYTLLTLTESNWFGLYQRIIQERLDSQGEVIERVVWESTQDGARCISEDSDPNSLRISEINSLFTQALDAVRSK